MEKYVKFKASTKYAKNKLKTISKCGLRGYDARTKKMLLRSSIKVNKRYEKGIHETAETALKILEQKKQLDTESKGQFIRYYMTSPLRLKFITILQILERNAHWEPEVHFQTYTPPSYSSPSYSSPSYSPPTHGYTQAASTAIRETDEIYKRFERRSEIQQLRRTGFAIDADELEASYKNKNLL